MSVSVKKNKRFIGIEFDKINYRRIFSVLNLLKIEKISIFIDEGNKYYFNGIVSTDEFVEYAIKLNEPLLIFDDSVVECLIDKEIETLSHSKILIGINLGENHVSILINRNRVDVPIENIKKII